MTAHPLPPQNKVAEAKAAFAGLIRKHGLHVIAIGNGSMCREMEQIVSDLIAELETRPTASRPSRTWPTSSSTRPGPASTRPARSAARSSPTSTPRPAAPSPSAGGCRTRSAELVKIDPQNIGVGLYQHDVNPKHLKESLEAVIESCVNYVGVDLNTASVPLLRHVSGLNQLVARELVEYRKQQRPVPQPRAAHAGARHRRGPLHAGGRLPQDPRRRQPARPHLDPPRELRRRPPAAGRAGLHAARPARPRTKLGRAAARSWPRSTPPRWPRRLQVGEPTLRDIIEALARPGRDPREDLPPPIFKKGILKLEDLQPGMELKGTVLNVVDFRRVRRHRPEGQRPGPHQPDGQPLHQEPVRRGGVGDVVTVWVVEVDKERKRVSLTMVAPGQERKPEPRPAFQAPPPRPPRQDRPPPQARPTAAAGPPRAAAAGRLARPARRRPASRRTAPPSSRSRG